MAQKQARAELASNQDGQRANAPPGRGGQKAAAPNRKAVQALEAKVQELQLALSTRSAAGDAAPRGPRPIALPTLAKSQEERDADAEVAELADAASQVEVASRACPSRGPTLAICSELKQVYCAASVEST